MYISNNYFKPILLLLFLDNVSGGKNSLQMLIKKSDKRLIREI